MLRPITTCVAAAQLHHPGPRPARASDTAFRLQPAAVPRSPTTSRRISGAGQDRSRLGRSQLVLDRSTACRRRSNLPSGPSCASVSPSRSDTYRLPLTLEKTGKRRHPTPSPRAKLRRATGPIRYHRGRSRGGVRAVQDGPSRRRVRVQLVRPDNWRVNSPDDWFLTTPTLALLLRSAIADLWTPS